MNDNFLAANVEFTVFALNGCRSNVLYSLTRFLFLDSQGLYIAIFSTCTLVDNLCHDICADFSNIIGGGVKAILLHILA